MEAMVNSDNVVRGGLTPKFKDTNTLLNMLKYEFKNVEPKKPEGLLDQDGVTLQRYDTGFDEFMVDHL